METGPSTEICGLGTVRRPVSGTRAPEVLGTEDPWAGAVCTVTRRRAAETDLM